MLEAAPTVATEAEITRMAAQRKRASRLGSYSRS